MNAGRFTCAAIVALSIAAFAAPAFAQSIFGGFWRAPITPPPPCVLDECLNGGKSPQSAPPPVPADTPATSSVATAPGAFDFYLLTFSWSPGFCDTGGAQKARQQCAVGAGLGFVVHGLWPQYTHGYPQDCDDGSRPVSRAALALTDGVYPDEGLARYEWRKHGTCTGLSPEAFFATVRRARDSIAIPDAFKAPSEEQAFGPTDIARAFIAANQGLRLGAMAIGCARGELEDVRLCLAKDLRSFVACPEVAQRTCRSPSISVAPVR
jgi:ribonuclease T2